MDNAPATNQPALSESEAAAEADRIIYDALRSKHEVPKPDVPTSFRDDTPLPAYGATSPVRQPDQRLVPEWAAGVAVASIGVGAGATGLGCCAWLVLQGLASVTLTSVLMVTLPFAGAAMLVTAAGVAISKARSAATTNVYEGPVVQQTTQTHTTTRSLFFARTHNDIRS